LVVIRFDRKDVAYEQALYNAVSRILERRPGSTFSLVAIAPNLGGAAKLSVDRNKARRNAENVLRSLQRMGLSPDRVSLSERTARATSTEVHLYLN
jgi:predicted deacylase